MAISEVTNGQGLTLLIQNKDKIYYPVTLDGVTIEWNKKGTAGKCSFKVMKDGVVDFPEGSGVAVNYNGTDLFAGYIFVKRRDKDGVIEILAYDQLRYLKNKSVLLYTNKKASEVITMLANDFKLKIGDIADTEYVIPKRNEDNATLFDIIDFALSATQRSNAKEFILYDDFGTLKLTNIEDMFVPILIDSETAENFDYESSIDRNTYNKIKLYYDNKETGKREIFQAEDSETQENWGVLQFCESINEEYRQGAPEKANQLLWLYNRVARSLNIDGAFGDVRVRAGSSIWVDLNVGDLIIRHAMLVESVIHKFEGNTHTMSLSLRGGHINE